MNYKLFFRKGNEIFEGEIMFDQDMLLSIISEDKKEAIVGWYHLLHQVNTGSSALKLAGLDPDLLYEAEGAGTFYGDELMQAGLYPRKSGRSAQEQFARPDGDFTSAIYLLHAVSGS